MASVGLRSKRWCIPYTYNVFEKSHQKLERRVVYINQLVKPDFPCGFKSTFAQAYKH